MLAFTLHSRRPTRGKAFPRGRGSLPEIFSEESCLALWAARVLFNSLWESRISGAATRRTKEVTEDCHRGGQLLPSCSVM